MVNAFRKVGLFRNQTSITAIDRRIRHYQNRSVGLRSPDSPTGILVQENGIVQTYSGINKLFLSLSQIGLTGNKIVGSANTVKFEVPSLHQFRINNHHLNPLTVTNFTRVKSTLAGLYVLDSEGRSVPLDEVLEEQPILETSTPDEAYLFQLAGVLMDSVDIELPDWLKDFL